MQSTLGWALKEWDIVCGALLAGEQALLLRKGGILEAENQFVLEHAQFFLFPTFIHQDPAGTKPQWRAKIQMVRAEPERITLAGWAEAVEVFEVPDRKRMDELSGCHIWDKALLDMRFGYRPEKPLFLVVVRAHRLAAPVVIENTLAYAGCKSWVPLEEAVDVRESMAVGEEKVQETLERVRAVFRA